MAEEEKEEQGEGGEKKKSSTILFAIIGALVLLLIIIGVVAFLLLSGGDEEAADPAAGGGAAQQQAVAGAEAPKPVKMKTDLLNVGPVYEMDRFIVNLLSQSGRRYLKVTLNLEMDSEGLIAELETKKPAVQDTIISILSSKTIEEISTVKGKEKLKEEIVGRLNEFLVDGKVQNVFFTQFVVQ